MDITNKSTVTVTAVLTAVAAVFGIYMLWKKNKKSRYSHPPLKDVALPTNWQQVGEVGKINIYPLKSGTQLSVDKAACTEKGLKEIETGGKLPLQDRSFVLCSNSNNGMITIRNNSKIIHVVTEAIDNQTVKFSHPDAATSFILKIPNDSEANNFVVMWFNEKVQIADCGDKAAKWFSQTLTGKDNQMRLGYYNKNIPERTIEGSWEAYADVYKKLRKEYLGEFSDIASYMMLGQSSVDDLNSRLKTPVTERNFRPNVVIKGSKPYAEDSWDWVKIGEVVFRAFKPTTRCTAIAVDPITGKKDSNLEPLRTLNSYRLTGEKVELGAPKLGIYLGVHQTGVIKVGDPVYVEEK